MTSTNLHFTISRVYEQVSDIFDKVKLRPDWDNDFLYLDIEGDDTGIILVFDKEHNKWKVVD